MPRMVGKRVQSQPTVKGQSLFDVTDLDCYVVETYGTRFFCVVHRALLWLS